MLHQWRKPNRLRHWCIIEKGKACRNLRENCDCDVSKSRHTLYSKYHWTDVGCSNAHAPSDLRHSFCAPRWQRPESNIACFRYNYTIINCLLTIVVHNYYAQLICYTYISKCCKSLTDWSIPLKMHCYQKKCPRIPCLWRYVKGTVDKIAQ